MKFYFFILLLAVVQASRPDFGDAGAQYSIKNTKWKKFKQLRKGVRIFVDACKVRLADPKNGRVDSNWKMEWIDDDNFKIFQSKTGRDKKGRRKTGYYKKFRLFYRKQQKNGEYWIEKRKMIKIKGMRQKMVQKYQYSMWFSGGTEADLSNAITTANTCSTAGKFINSNYRYEPKKKSRDYFKKCGNSVSETCAGQEVEMSDEGWQAMVEEAVDGSTFLLNALVARGGSEFSFNMLRGINAGRCTITNLGTNFWNLFGAVYYFAMEFEYENEVEKLINEIYPYECTCTEEIETLKEKLGAKANALVVMSGCSEEIQKTSANNEEVKDGGVPRDSVDAYDSEEDDE